MPQFRIVLLAFCIFFSVGCLVSGGGGHLVRKPKLRQVTPLLSIDLVGTKEYRRHGCFDETMTKEQLEKYLQVLLTEHDNRWKNVGYVIIVYSSDVPPSSESAPWHSDQMAPILAAARQYGCDVDLLYPERFGPASVQTYYRLFPSRQSKGHR